eukprot:9450824-Karenia_brevis.AAC.1
MCIRDSDFTFCGLDGDLKWIRSHMKSWFEVKVRAVLGPEEKDGKEVTILGRVVRWTDKGIEYEAGPKHRRIILEYFRFDEKAKP